MWDPRNSVPSPLELYSPIEINLAGPDEADESPRRKVNPKKKQRKIVKSIRHNK